MILINNQPEPECIIPKCDGNIIKWSGYFATTELAQQHLEEKTKQFADTENKLVLSTKKDFINRHFKGYFLYKFTVILTSK
jgi:hypothetical protein